MIRSLHIHSFTKQKNHLTNSFLLISIPKTFFPSQINLMTHQHYFSSQSTIGIFHQPVKVSIGPNVQWKVARKNGLSNFLRKILYEAHKFEPEKSVKALDICVTLTKESQRQNLINEKSVQKLIESISYRFKKYPFTFQISWPGVGNLSWNLSLINAQNNYPELIQDIHDFSVIRTAHFDHCALSHLLLSLSFMCENRKIFVFEIFNRAASHFANHKKLKRFKVYQVVMILVSFAKIHKFQTISSSSLPFDLIDQKKYGDDIPIIKIKKNGNENDNETDNETDNDDDENDNDENNLKTSFLEKSEFNKGIHNIIIKKNQKLPVNVDMIDKMFRSCLKWVQTRGYHLSHFELCCVIWSCIASDQKFKNPRILGIMLELTDYLEKEVKDNLIENFTILAFLVWASKKINRVEMRYLVEAIGIKFAQMTIIIKPPLTTTTTTEGTTTTTEGIEMTESKVVTEGTATPGTIIPKGTKIDFYILENHFYSPTKEKEKEKGRNKGKRKGKSKEKKNDNDVQFDDKTIDEYFENWIKVEMKSLGVKRRNMEK